MALALYSTLFRLLLPLFALRLLIRSRKAPAYRTRMLERLGVSEAVVKQPLWIHAVSVGEVIAISPLVERLLAAHPEIPILVTTMTPTGAEQVAQKFGVRVAHRYIPWDTPGAVARFFNRHRPRAGIIVETELWPNLLNSCKQRSMPLLLANARLSAKSLRGYQRLSGLTSAVLDAFTHVCAQHQADADRFVALGMPKKSVSVDGSIKFDLSIPEEQLLLGKSWRRSLGAERPVLIAASTHEGEDEIALRAWRVACNNKPRLALILVPRHPERFDSVLNLAKRFSSQVGRRSSGEPPSAETQIWIGDSLGEMLAYYTAADIAFVGGSFSGTGGHNPLEPAALGKPIVMGPSRYNFAAISDELEQAGALYQVTDAADMAQQSLRLLGSPDFAREAGLRVVQQNRGALDRLCVKVEQYLLV